MDGQKIQCLGWGVPRSISGTKPKSSCHSLLGEGVEEAHTDTHTKGPQLHKQGNSVSENTGLSYKRTMTISFRWNASVQGQG